MDFDSRRGKTVWQCLSWGVGSTPRLDFRVGRKMVCVFMVGGGVSQRSHRESVAARHQKMVALDLALAGDR